MSRPLKHTSKQLRWIILGGAATWWTEAVQHIKGLLLQPGYVRWTVFFPSLVDSRVLITPSSSVTSRKIVQRFRIHYTPPQMRKQQDSAPTQKEQLRAQSTVRSLA